MSVIGTNNISSVIGQSIPRVDALEKVIGKAQYLGDIELQGMLCGKILRSPLPHARIVSIDISQAESLPGVKAVITAEDTPKVTFGGKKETEDQNVLATGKVRFVGEEVAAVAAENEEIAAKALSLIRVVYEELPAVFDVDQALAEGAALVHAGVNNNVAFQVLRQFGDVEQGFRESDHVFEDEFETSPVTPAYMEPRGCVVEVDPSGRIKVYTTNQTPHLMPSRLSQVLQIPENKFRIIEAYSGGAFGTKIFIDPIDPICVLLAIKSGRPVRIMFSREEDFVGTRFRHPIKFKLKTGTKSDGTILARELTAISNNGAYSSLGPQVLNVALVAPFLMYKIPNVKLQGKLVYTNNPYGGAFQGFGNPQGTFATESQMDMIAERLNIDPVDLRLKNAVETGYTTVSGTKVVSCGIRECTQKAMEIIDWKSKRGSKGNRGIGMAFMVHPNSSKSLVGVNFADCVIKIFPDGLISVLSGSVDLGQGSATVLTQIVAEELGATVDMIRILPVDTDVSPADIGTHGTRVTLVAGNAAKIAANAAKRELFKIAAKCLGVSEDKLQARGGFVFPVESPGTRLELKELACKSFFELGQPIITRGCYQPESNFDVVTGYGNYSPTFSFACQIAEVEVDVETGKVEVVNFASVHDVGRAINPMAIEGQIEGAVCKGIGYALTEELVWQNGKTLNPSFKDYKCLTFADMPKMTSALVETFDPVGPFGAKGVAEPGLVATAPAIANAIFNAVGVRINKLPMSAERVLEVMAQQLS